MIGSTGAVASLSAKECAQIAKKAARIGRGKLRGLTGPVKLEKVLERLATTDKVTFVFERAPDGKVRVTSGSWDGEKVILKDQVLEGAQC